MDHHEPSFIPTLPEYLRTGPRVAWPTLGILVLSYIVWFVAVGLFREGWITLVPAMGIAIVAGYMVFTVAHDSVHEAVFDSDALNYLSGIAVGILLASPYSGFRVLHLAHHSKCNTVGHDADVWSGGGKTWTLPFRWLTQDLYYYYFITTKMLHLLSLSQMVIIVTELLVLIGIGVGAALAGFETEVLYLWFISGRLAVMFLAFALNYLPHRPMGDDPDNPYASTINIGGKVAAFFFLCQNYHLVHHLYPHLPFYRYSQVLEEVGEELELQGAVHIGVFDALPGRRKADP